MLKKNEAIYFLLDNPVALGHLLGFTKLTDIHNVWLKSMIYGKGDDTLQGHRGSYKTTCLSIALAIICVVAPNDKTLFMRKTDDDVKEIIEQVKKILQSSYMRAISLAIYGVDLKIIKASSNEITTNLSVNDPRGTAQIVAQGTTSSMTGKHYDRIFTDDIVNLNDRFSKAERERTKRVYDELQNLKNRDGRIFNTGTPWHVDDAFSKMPPARKFDCYSTGLMSEEEIRHLKERMIPSLFSANYELRHIASEDVIFQNPNRGADISLAEQGVCHIDASYGGSDFTAFTICNKHDGNYYILGKLWHKHIDDVEDEIISIRRSMNAGRISCELNGDKGYLAKDLQRKGERTHTYHENMNKFLKITSYLKAEWKNVYFVNGTDEEYIQQILDFNENAEHDDAPDSCASIIRELWRKQTPKQTTSKSGSYFI